MPSFSGVTFILFCFVVVFFLSMKSRPLVQSFFVLRYAYAPTAICVSSFFPLFHFCFFGDVAFFDFVCTIIILSLYGEYVVRFPLPDVVFLPWDHGLFLYYINQHIMCDSLMGNGQKRELPVLFGQKQVYPENNSGGECCWPYLIGQHQLSPVFGQKRPGTPGNSYFAQLPPVFGHFMFLSGGLLDMGHKNNKQQNFAQVTWRLTKLYHFSVSNFGSNQL